MRTGARQFTTTFYFFRFGASEVYVDAHRMAVKAIAVDDANTHHLIIGLNRENIESLLRGDVFTLPHGMAVPLSEESDIVVLFAETDEDLGKRFPPSMRPI